MMKYLKHLKENIRTKWNAAVRMTSWLRPSLVSIHSKCFQCWNKSAVVSNSNIPLKDLQLRIVLRDDMEGPASHGQETGVAAVSCFHFSFERIPADTDCVGLRVESWTPHSSRSSWTWKTHSFHNPFTVFHTDPTFIIIIMIITINIIIIIIVIIVIISSTFRWLK